MQRPLSAFAFCALLVTACGASSADIAAVNALTGDATSGASLYAANCQTCHGAEGSTKAPAAATAKSDTDAAISTILTGDGEMQSFSGTLSNQQIADIIAYLKTL